MPTVAGNDFPDDPPSGIATEASRESLRMLMARLYPICRSITGNGVRETLKILRNRIPLTVHEIPTGTAVFDWVIPKEWNIEKAFIRDPDGKKIVDFTNSNLHVVSYSIPFYGKLPLVQLKEHLFSIPEHPDWIPYRTSYYRENWGFCLPHRQLQAMPDGEYEVHISSSLRDGSLSYGEYCLQGESEEEILLSCHIGHPSLCNDNLSGIALMIALYSHLSKQRTRYSYRFLFIPGTIGSIAWLALNESRVSLIRHGLVIAGTGDKGPFTYKKSRRGDAEIDRAFSYLLSHSCDGSKVMEFQPYGYDERQFCSPGFDLPVGCVMRTPFGQYPEYHTSADNLEFVSLDALTDSIAKCMAGLQILESNGRYLNKNPKCEPQLGKRGLYSIVGGQSHSKAREMAVLWVLNMSDGAHSLLDIADRSGCAYDLIEQAANDLIDHRLLTRLPDGTVQLG